MAAVAAVLGATGGVLGAGALAGHVPSDQDRTDHVVFVSHDGDGGGGPGRH